MITNIKLTFPTNYETYISHVIYNMGNYINCPRLYEHLYYKKKINYYIQDMGVDITNRLGTIRLGTFEHIGNKQLLFVGAAIIYLEGIIKSRQKITFKRPYELRNRTVSISNDIASADIALEYLTKLHKYCQNDFGDNRDLYNELTTNVPLTSLQLFRLVGLVRFCFCAFGIWYTNDNSFSVIDVSNIEVFMKLLLPVIDSNIGQLQEKQPYKIDRDYLKEIYQFFKKSSVAKLTISFC